MAFPPNGLPGIDVSHYQGHVDWTQVAANGELFAFCKATESIGATDQYFADNWNGIKAAGLLRGAYHFFHPDQDATKQAQYFLSALTKANGSATLAPGDLPITLDLEISGNQAPAAILAGAELWLKTIADATGRQPLLYTFTSFWKNNLGNPKVLSNYPLWIAQYSSYNPLPIGAWPTYTLWQFGQQPIPGVAGPVDANSFQGSPQDLKTLAGQS